jgi:hypothetical protein
MTEKAKSTAKPAPKKVAIKVDTLGKVAPKNPSVKAPKAEKPKKQKMVRDSFTMPQAEYARIAELKARCLKAGLGIKKSEVLRAALEVMSKLSDKQLLNAFNKLEIIKTGRPSKT